MSFEHTFAEWATNGVKSAPSDELQSTGFVGGMKPPASVFNYQWDKTGKAITELQTEVNTQATTLSEHNSKIEAIEKVAGVNPIAPYSYVYDTDGDVLGVVKDVASYSKTATFIPYNLEGENITDKARCYANSNNEYYAEFATTTSARTARLYIDIGIPPSATISSLMINVKVGSSNISSATWTTRAYAIKSGGNTLASGSFTLGTSGKMITATITDMTKIVSPIIVVELTAQTTSSQYVKIYGADVSITYSATQEYVSLVRQSTLACDAVSDALSTHLVDENAHDGLFAAYEHTHTSLYTATVSTSWTEDTTNGGYYQTITVSGILESDTPVVDVVLGSDIDANALYIEAWACVTRITTAADSITLWANDTAPTNAFTIQLGVVR